MTDWKEEIYNWRMGYDNEDLKFLTKMNIAIDFLYDLNDIENYLYRMNIALAMGGKAKETVCELTPLEIVSKLELVRTLIFGAKVNYMTLQKALEEGIEEYGYTQSNEDNEEDNT